MIPVKSITKGSFLFLIRRSIKDIHYYEVDILPRSMMEAGEGGIKLGHSYYDLQDAEEAIEAFVTR